MGWSGSSLTRRQQLRDASTSLVVRSTEEEFAFWGGGEHAGDSHLGIFFLLSRKPSQVRQLVMPLSHEGRVKTRMICTSSFDLKSTLNLAVQQCGHLSYQGFRLIRMITANVLLCVQLTILVWAEPKIQNGVQNVAPSGVLE